MKKSQTGIIEESKDLNVEKGVEALAVVAVEKPPVVNVEEDWLASDHRKYMFF